MRELPVSLYSQFAGRDINVIKTHGERYELPTTGDTISLPEVLRAFHDFLIDNGRKLNKPSNDDWKELERKESYELAKLKRLALAGDLVDREEMHAINERIALHLAGCGDRLERAYGPEAREILSDSIAAMRREIAAAPEKAVGE